MQCPECQFDNREGAKFCSECGFKFELSCPECSNTNRSNSKFCDECGCTLESTIETTKNSREIEAPLLQITDIKKAGGITPIEGERKHVTVLFSDISGYTAMSERLDPEEVKDITSQIFDEISKIVNRYDGFVEKFAGDAVMALFGAQEAHEDDPVRALRAAREIHNLVNSLSPKYEEIIERPLSMHTGINTGLVVTGDINLEKGTHGVAGDTLNVAARLSSIGNADDIMVGSDTFYQAEGFFNFESLEPVKVKGKADPIRIYRVLDSKEQPRKVHRLQGVRADLIGRIAEMRQLKNAVEKLRQRQGSVVSISGTAGTGKSRLIEEFKASIDLKEIQWHEGHAYPYAQNIPYSPLINMLSRALQIEEADSVEKVKGKIETGIANLLDDEEDVIPYIGSLFSLPYPEIEDVSPEFWQTKLFKAAYSVLAALGRRGPTVICLEDLHWADPSFLDLIRWLLVNLRFPILLLCVYRPIITVFTSQQINALALPYEEIRLQDLSASESQAMVESLLETNTVPEGLQRFIQDKIEGNPFYLEEMINSLIESRALVRDNGNWILAKAITEADISSTVHGVISSRLDRLENETKRILQEASVIGRTFYYEILTRVTVLKKNIDSCLSFLERLDLIKTRVIHPDLEYFFKHALTQEVVYSGLLKKERREIHERIACVIEQIFQERLPEFYEVLAYHFSKGKSVLKAVEYLVKAGEKNLKRYSLEESHQYYQEAFKFFDKKVDNSKENVELLISLLINWARVYYYRGDFKELEVRLRDHDKLASSINDAKKKGMYYAWYGFTLSCRGKNKEALHYLNKALQIGEENGNYKIIGYACTWLTWVYPELGLMKKAINYGERAQEIYRNHEPDQYINFKSLAGIASAYVYLGEHKKAFKVGKTLIDFGYKHSNIRGLTTGHALIGGSYFADGNFLQAIESFKKSIHISADPIYSQSARAALGLCYILNGQFQDAINTLQEAANFCREFGFEFYGILAEIGLSISQIATGQINEGFKKLEQIQRASLNSGRKYYYAMLEHILGKLYSQIALGEGEVKLFDMVKNIGFLIKTIPIARKKAETHLYKAVELAKEIGANGLVGLAYLDLGILYKGKNRAIQAKEYISEAVIIFEKCESEVYLKQAKEALASLA